MCFVPQKFTYVSYFQLGFPEHIGTYLVYYVVLNNTHFSRIARNWKRLIFHIIRFRTQSKPPSHYTIPSHYAMPFFKRETRTASPDPTTLCAVLQEDLFMSTSSYDTAEKKKSRWGGKKEKVEAENNSMSPSHDTNATEKKSNRKWGKKGKVETETENREGDWSPSRVDAREEEEAKTGRKKGKDLRQQLEGPQAKVVFHHFSADSAEDILKVEGESAAPSLNTEYDVMIKVEVRYDAVLLFKTNENRQCLNDQRVPHLFIY
jgi:hypothetical protein